MMMLTPIRSTDIGHVWIPTTSREKLVTSEQVAERLGPVRSLHQLYRISESMAGVPMVNVASDSSVKDSVKS